MRLALYGHPDAGGYWERHCENHFRRVGFVPIPEWQSSFWHPSLQCLLIVYVDDFKLAGPVGNLPRIWELISKDLRIGDPSPLGLYLGCHHDISVKKHPVTGKEVRVLEYNMESFLEQCVARYKELSGVQNLRGALTPFYDDRTALTEPTQRCPRQRGRPWFR